MVLKNSDMYKDSHRTGIRTWPSFKIAIHDPMSTADLRRSGVEVEPGLVTTFLITPSQIVTSSSLKVLNEQQRQCRFHFESEKLKLFTKYTQSSCHLECQVKDAYESCKCIPWNYPHFEDGIPICHRFSQKCFEMVMANMTLSNACDCPFDCATTRYVLVQTNHKILHIIQ